MPNGGKSMVVHSARGFGDALHVNSDERAEVGVGALIMFIAFMIAAVVVSSSIIQGTEKLFSQSKSDGQASTQPFNGIVHVVRLEIWALGGTDEIAVTFELPYQGQPLPEDDLSWVLMCTYAASTAIEFDQGQFQLATTLAGDGLTSLPLTEFEPGDIYYLRMELDTCDLETISPTTATLVLMVEQGRTTEIKIDVTGSPFVGMDLM